MQRYPGAYPRPRTGPRVDHALPVDKTQPLPHADQSETVASHHGLGIEANALVRHVQLNLAVPTPERDRHVANRGVLHRVPHRFLHHTKQRERDVVRHVDRNARVVDSDRHLVLRGQLLAEDPRSRRESEPLQARRVQLVGERKDFAGYGSKLAAQFFDTASHLLLAGAHGYLSQAVELRREHDHALTEIVLKLSGNPRSFVLMGLHQTLAQTRESEPCKLQIRDVNRRADVAFKAAILEKPRRAGVEDPSIFAVVPAEPILHPEGSRRSNALR